MLAESTWAPFLLMKDLKSEIAGRFSGTSQTSPGVTKIGELCTLRHGRRCAEFAWGFRASRYRAKWLPDEYLTKPAHGNAVALCQPTTCRSIRRSRSSAGYPSSSRISRAAAPAAYSPPGDAGVLLRRGGGGGWARDG